MRVCLLKLLVHKEGVRPTNIHFWLRYVLWGKVGYAGYPRALAGKLVLRWPVTVTCGPEPQSFLLVPPGLPLPNFLGMVVMAEGVFSKGALTRLSGWWMKWVRLEEAEVQ